MYCFGMEFLRRAFHLSPLGLAIAGSIAPVFLSVLTLGAEVPNFFDPCRSWGITSDRQLYDPACRGRMSGTSETRLRTMLRLAIIQGGMLTACAAALVGAYRFRLFLSLAACVFMALITIPLSLENFGMLTLVSAICFEMSSALVAPPAWRRRTTH